MDLRSVAGTTPTGLSGATLRIMSAVGGFPARPHRVLRNPRLVDVIVAGLLTAGALSALSSLSYRGSVALAVRVVRRLHGHGGVSTARAGHHLFCGRHRDARLPAHDPRSQGPFESVAVVLTLFMSGRRGIGRANPAPLAVLLAYALAACALISGGSSVFGVALSWVLLAVLPMAAGATVARRGELTRDLADTAARLKDEQEMRAARAAGEERNRVARDLHDVVAHSVSVMVIQAGAARLVADADPSAARAALGVVEASGREAMADLRRIMGVLRRGDDALAGPPVGLAQLNGLIDRIRVGGVPTELRVEGQPGPLPPMWAWSPTGSSRRR